MHSLEDQEYFCFSPFCLGISQACSLFPLAVAHAGDSKLKILLRPTVTFLNSYPFCRFDVSKKVKNVAYV